MQRTDLTHGRGWLAAPAAASLARVDAEIGHPLQITEAGRSGDEQQAHRDRYVAYLSGGPWAPLAARRGESPHEFGNAIDTNERLVELLARHGWYRPLKSEPWHFVHNTNNDQHRNDPAPAGTPEPPKRRKKPMFSGSWRVPNGTIAVQCRPGGALTLLGDPNEFDGLAAGSGVQAAGVSDAALDTLIARYGVVPWPFFDDGRAPVTIVAPDDGSASRYAGVGDRLAGIPVVAHLAGLQHAGVPVVVLPVDEIDAKLAWRNF